MNTKFNCGRSKAHHHAYMVRQEGVSLLESLVALLVLALGVLGMLGIQLKTLADNQTATHRVVAVRLADDLFERIKANASGDSGLASYVPSVVTGSTWPTFTTPTASQRCDANVCTSAQQAAFDLWTWQTQVRNTLPGGNASTFVSPSDPQQLGVMLAWRLRNTDQTTNTTTNAARAAWLNVDVAGGPACPADSICLVTYGKP